MAKFDEQLSRMEYLMSYRNPVNEGKNNIEYHINGADGKVYGIIKEGNKYYIKTTEKGKENISESYNYINGYNYRRENAFNSYNSASKALEIKMINLNESYGIHEDVSTVDFNKGSKVLASLTEEARKELNRVQQIMENSMGISTNIGNHGNPESKGSSTGANTTKNNEPFSQKASASLEKDSVASASNPVKANSDYKDASKGIDADLQSDKMKGKGDKSLKDYTAAHDDLDGEGVADKKPSGGKAVMVNEEYEDWMEDGDVEGEESLDDVTGSYGDDDMAYDDFDDEDFEVEDLEGDDFEDDGFEDSPEGGFDSDLDYEELMDDDYEMEGTEGDIVGFDGEGDYEDVEGEDDGDLEDALMEFEDLIAGSNKTMEGPHGTEYVMTWDKMDECEVGSQTDDGEPALKGPKGNGNNLTWDKMNESKKFNRIVENITRNVMRKIQNKKPMKETIEQKIARMVNEEMVDLGYGKHPRYGQEPFTTPENPEGDGRLVGTATKDWNHSSAKGKQRYGQKIGNGAPYINHVDKITNSVINEIKRMSLKKK